MALIGDRIVAVGSKAEIDLWRGPQTKVVDAAGKLLLPGFNDAHLHFIQGGAQLDHVQLTDAATPEEFAKRIIVPCRALPESEGRLIGNQIFRSGTEVGANYRATCRGRSKATLTRS